MKEAELKARIMFKLRHHGAPLTVHADGTTGNIDHLADEILELFAAHHNQIKGELSKKWPEKDNEDYLEFASQQYAKGYNQALSEAWQVVEDTLR